MRLIAMFIARFASTGETLQEASRRLGLSTSALRARLRYGWSEVDVLTAPKHTRIKARLIEFQGTARTLSGWAAVAGLHVTTLASRLVAGRPLAEALVPPRRPVDRLEPRKVLPSIFVGWCLRCAVGSLIWYAGHPPVCNSCGYVWQ